jgi:hypothetical protein
MTKCFCEKSPNGLQKWPKNVAQPVFRQIEYSEKVAKKMGFLIDYQKNGLKNCPNGGNSPNLVTLLKTCNLLKNINRHRKTIFTIRLPVMYVLEFEFW